MTGTELAVWERKSSLRPDTIKRIKSEASSKRRKVLTTAYLVRLWLIGFVIGLLAALFSTGVNASLGWGIVVLTIVGAFGTVTYTQKQKKDLFIDDEMSADEFRARKAALTTITCPNCMKTIDVAQDWICGNCDNVHQLNASNFYRYTTPITGCVSKHCSDPAQTALMCPVCTKDIILDVHRYREKSTNLPPNDGLAMPYGSTVAKTALNDSQLGGADDNDYEFFGEND